MKNTDICTENCTIARGSKTYPEKIENRHFPMTEELATFLESQDSVLGKKVRLDARERQIINKTTGEIYESITQLNALVAPGIPYAQFYDIFKPVLRDGVPFGGCEYDYADNYTHTQLENVILKAEVNNLNKLVIELEGSMENLKKLSEMSTARIKRVSDLLGVDK